MNYTYLKGITVRSTIHYIIIEITTHPLIAPYKYVAMNAKCILLNDLCNSCNPGTSDLPDMHTRSLRTAGPRAEGGHIRQATSACVTTIM